MPIGHIFDEAAREIAAHKRRIRETSAPRLSRSQPDSVPRGDCIGGGLSEDVLAIEHSCSSQRRVPVPGIHAIKPGRAERAAISLCWRARHLPLVQASNSLLSAQRIQHVTHTNHLGAASLLPPTAPFGSGQQRHPSGLLLHLLQAPG